MKRVLVLANNLQQASYRVRVEALLPLLRERGIEPTVGLRTGKVLADRRLYASAASFDAVLLQRKFLANWEAARLRHYARRIVYDIDDALMYFNRPVGWWSRRRNASRYATTAAAVDHVVAGNEYLADHFRRLGKTVTVLPTVVDPSRYQIKRHASTDIPRLVWIGSSSTMPYVRERFSALKLAAERVPGLRLVVIADRTLPDVPLPVDFIPWSAATEATSLVEGDIGIAPTPSDPWTLGKCGFKIVQYMAAGLPTVASPVGANAELVTEGTTGFLADSDEEWANRIGDLVRDHPLRSAFGSAARDRVERELCLRRAADVWASVL